MGAIIWQILSSGLQILRTDYPILLIVALTSILPFGLWVALMLFRYAAVRDAAVLFSGGLCGGIVLDALLSFVSVIIFPAAWLPAVFWGTAILLWGGNIMLFVRWRFMPEFSLAFWGLLVMFVALLIIRLAFVIDLFLPLYTDSVEHYTIIQDLVTGRIPPHSYYNLAAFPQVYYHYGYHSLITRQVVLGLFEPARVMLILGQLYLVVTAMGLYFSVALFTHSRLASFFAALAAGILWAMPDYAINWGKYPAVTVGVALPFFMGVSALYLQSNNRQHNRLILGLALLSGVGCVLLHSRMTIILILLGIAYGFSSLIIRQKFLYPVAIIGLLLLLGVWYLSTPVLFNESFEIYWRFGPAPLIIALVASVWCCFTHPRLVLISFLTVALALVAMILPLPAFLEKTQGLIDRPFFQITLFVPLSVLTGVGLAEFAYRMKNRHLRIGLAVMMGIGLWLCAPLAQTTRPSSCCQLTGSDDLFVYQWLENQALSEDRILISAYQSPFRLVESDGGAWVEALTLRSTEKIVNTIDFSSPDQQKALCAAGINYIYAGSSPYSFDRSALAAQPDIYVPEIQLPQVSLYRLNCDE